MVYICTCIYILQILKSHFGMLAPDVDIQDGKGTILISSEEGETDSERADSGFFSRKFLGGRREGGDSSGKSQNLNLNVVLWGYNIMLVADLKVGRGSREGMFHPDRDVE